MLEGAEGLPGEAEDMKGSVQPEFDNLGAVQKGKALFALGMNIKVVTKIPSAI